MSVYREIRTEYKTAQSLIKALTDLGFAPKTSVDLRANSLEMVSGYHSDNRFNVAIQVDRAQVGSKAGTHVYGGIGFAWSNGSYALVVDDLDSDKPAVQTLLNNLKQRYTYQEVKRQAFTKGYTVTEQLAPNGTIRLQLRSLT